MSAVLSPPLHTQTLWRTALVALGAVLLVLSGLYADTVVAMVGIWSRSDTFAHAFLVPPISLWLIWRQRERLAQLVPQPQPWLLLALAAAALLWLLGDLVNVNAATQLAWVAMLVLAVPAVLGFQVAHAILFPLLFLFFAVPIGDFMLSPMMDWTADFTIAALQMSGVPVYREGLQFVIPSGNWSVVEACSGVRYLIASFMVGTLFAYLNYRSTTRRVVFMLVSIAVPIVANWLRAYMIVMLGHFSGNTIAVGADHLIYGWVFFGIVIMIMFVIGARWSEPDEPVSVASSAAVDDHTVTRADWRARPVAVAALMTATVMALPHAVLWGLAHQEQGAGAASVQLPAALAAGWRGVESPGVSFKPHFVNPSVEAARSYAGAGGEVGVYLAYYRNEGAERKLVSSVNSLVRSSDTSWNQVASGGRSVSTPSGDSAWRTASVRHTVGAGGARRAPLQVWRAYWVDGRWVAGDAQAKLTAALGRLQGRGDDGAALVIYTEHEDPAQANALLETFARDNLGTLQGVLQTARAAR
jgi:exosortase A